MTLVRVLRPTGDELFFPSHGGLVTEGFFGARLRFGRLPVSWTGHLMMQRNTPLQAARARPPAVA